MQTLPKESLSSGRDTGVRAWFTAGGVMTELPSGTVTFLFSDIEGSTG
jgi:hypothetical protein